MCEKSEELKAKDLMISKLSENKKTRSYSSSGKDDIKKLQERDRALQAQTLFLSAEVYSFLIF